MQKKKSTKIHKMLKLAYVKKKKTEIDRKKIIPSVSWDTIRVRV